MSSQSSHSMTDPKQQNAHPSLRFIFLQAPIRRRDRFNGTFHWETPSTASAESSLVYVRRAYGGMVRRVGFVNGKGCRGFRRGRLIHPSHMLAAGDIDTRRQGKTNRSLLQRLPGASFGCCVAAATASSESGTERWQEHINDSDLVAH